MNHLRSNNISNLASKTRYIMVHYGPIGTLNGTTNQTRDLQTRAYFALEIYDVDISVHWSLKPLFLISILIPFSSKCALS